METGLLSITLWNLGMSLAISIIALVVGIVAVLLVDRYLLRGINIQQELAKGNMAVALFASAILLFVAVIFAFGLRT